MDTTIRPLCFGLTNPVSKDQARMVGPEKFKRYEHALYVTAQVARLVYSDSGIAWKAMEHLGRSNDIVNKVINAYDSQFSAQRRAPITSQAGDGEGRPMESYSLVASKGAGPKYATFISTPGDLTVLFVNASKVAQNPYSIFQPTDVFISFKGSSTIKNLKHDVMSQFTPADFASMVASIGIQSQPGNMVTGAFVKPIMKAWVPLMRALAEHATQPNTRLILTGHSLGGSYSTLFAFILAEGRAVIPQMKNVSSIHVISFGAPTIFSDKSRNTFNAHLDSGFLTFDRVVNQKIAARSAATQLLVGGIAGPNDVIPNIPAGFSHPGFRPLATELNPESAGRPYSIENVRGFYGVPSKTRYRDPQTWPFQDSIALGDIANAAQLDQIVKGLTGVQPPPEPSIESAAAVAGQSGGGLLVATPEKDKYNIATKTHIPNFLSIQGSAHSYAFAHAEYLGMFYIGGFRLLGMKNPAAKSIAYFSIYNDGVKIEYVPKDPTDVAVEPMVGGRRKTRGRKNRKSKKTRRT